jgi:hypothetical protein
LVLPWNMYHLEGLNDFFFLACAETLTVTTYKEISPMYFPAFIVWQNCKYFVGIVRWVLICVVKFLIFCSFSFCFASHHFPMQCDAGISPLILLLVIYHKVSLDCPAWKNCIKGCVYLFSSPRHVSLGFYALTHSFSSQIFAEQSIYWLYQCPS